jgi:hypothetical protein
MGLSILAGQSPGPPSERYLPLSEIVLASSLEKGDRRDRLAEERVEVERNGVKTPASMAMPRRPMVEWSGVEWSGVEWSGVEWSGVEWSGVEWSGVEWSGVHPPGTQVTNSDGIFLPMVSL